MLILQLAIFAAMYATTDRMKIFFSLILLVLASFPMYGQEITIQGAVIEKKTQTPLEFVTVTAHDTSNAQVIAGTVTDESGKFVLNFEEKPFFLRLRLMGFKDLELRNLEGNQVNLGNIELESNVQELGEVTARAEQSQTIFKLDKRVFNVGKDLSSSGGSALDVLNNVPSVEVTLEGLVQLRGNSNVQILINGKPSVLTNGSTNALGSITAEMIDRIEVITNPSAKYDAEGTSGIINIVLREEKKKGFSGSATVNTGYPSNNSVGLSMSNRTEKFNLFSQLGAGRRSMLSWVDGASENQLPAYSRLENVGTGEKNETFINVVLGADYYITDRDVITLSGHFAYEWEDENSSTFYELLDASQLVTSSMNRAEQTVATNPKYQYNLEYNKEFKGSEDHVFSLATSGSFFGKDKRSGFSNRQSSGSFSDFDQRMLTDFLEAEYIFQSDYTKPLKNGMKWDLGAKYSLNQLLNDYRVLDFINGTWQDNASFTNVFGYDQQVTAGYSTFAWEKDKFGAQAGLRYEYTDIRLELETTGETGFQGYGNWFPSAHVSYKWTDKLSMQLGYSRRIWRPGLWDLNPFNSFRDNFNISVGNPQLLPEFTNSFEWSTIQNWKKLSISAIVYYAQTDNVINDWITVVNNVSITSPQNIGTSEDMGMEWGIKYNPSKSVSFLLDADWEYFRRVGDFQGSDFDFSSTRWSARLLSKFKLPWDFEFQWTMRYASAEKDVFIDKLDNYFADAGIRKKLFKRRGVINFSVRDVFATRRFASERRDEDFYFYSNRRRGRYVVLGFSYSFGKGEAMEFSGHKMF